MTDSSAYVIPEQVNVLLLKKKALGCMKRQIIESFQELEKSC